MRLVALGTKQQELITGLMDSQVTRSQTRGGLDFPEWLLLNLPREWILGLHKAPAAHEAPQLPMDLSRSLHMLLLYSPISLATSTSTLAAAGPCYAFQGIFRVHIKIQAELDFLNTVSFRFAHVVTNGKICSFKVEQ